MIIAVEGCAHGELDQIYRSVENLANQRGVKVDLLICCGDFQAVRNENDLQCMAVPDKFRHICTFYKQVCLVCFINKQLLNFSFSCQILQWWEDCSNTNHLHWWEPWSFKLSTGVAIWRLGCSKHILSWLCWSSASSKSEDCRNLRNFQRTWLS